MSNLQISYKMYNFNENFFFFGKLYEILQNIRESPNIPRIPRIMSNLKISYKIYNFNENLFVSFWQIVRNSPELLYFKISEQGWIIFTAARWSGRSWQKSFRVGSALWRRTEEVGRPCMLNKFHVEAGLYTAEPLWRLVQIYE